MKGISLNEIEEYSKSLGFQDFKATNFRDFSIYSKNLREFIENKFYGEMGWIKEKSFIRENPKNIWLDAKSALVFGLNYGPASNPLSEITNRKTGYISVYARRKDYHKVVKTKLNYRRLRNIKKVLDFCSHIWSNVYVIGVVVTRELTR